MTDFTGSKRVAYTYKDFASGKIHKTYGTFSGWTAPGGPLDEPYAIFSNRAGDVLVPGYCLTKETKAALRELKP